MKIIIACDSFKGSCSTDKVAASIADGIHAMAPDATIDQILIADGGEGTMRTLVQALNGQLRQTPAHDALMRPIQSEYGWLANEVAVLDMAETCGLTRFSKDELRPVEATTYGLGEQMADALHHGCKKMLIGLGGSATTDGGEGAIRALQDLDALSLAQQCTIEVLCDVTNPLYGPNGAAYIYGPQKGATPEQVELLDQRLRQWAASSPHPEVANIEGAGAAGGLGFALMGHLGGKLVSGINTVLHYQDFDTRVQGADLVITGEGKIDRQTLMNKAPLGVLRHAQKANVPVIAVAGRVEHRDELIAAGFRDVCCINPAGTPVEVAMQPDYAAERLRLTAKAIIQTL